MPAATNPNRKRVVPSAANRDWQGAGHGRVRQSGRTRPPPQSRSAIDGLPGPRPISLRVHLRAATEPAETNHDRKGVVPPLRTATGKGHGPAAAKAAEPVPHPSPEAASTGYPRVFNGAGHGPAAVKADEPVPRPQSRSVSDGLPGPRPISLRVHLRAATEPAETNHDRKGVVPPLRTATGKERATAPQSPKRTNPSPTPVPKRHRRATHASSTERATAQQPSKRTSPSPAPSPGASATGYPDQGQSASAST
jgi:hypothetical protein